MGDVANDLVRPSGQVPAQQSGARPATAAARSEEVHRALVQVVVDGGGLQEVTDELVGVLGGVVAATTPDGRADYMNQRWEEYAGERPVGNAWQELVHPDDRPALVARWTRSVRRTGRSRTSGRSRSWSSATPTASRSS